MFIIKQKIMKQINLIYKYRVFSLIAMMALSLLGASCKDEDNFEALESENNFGDRAESYRAAPVVG